MYVKVRKVEIKSNRRRKSLNERGTIHSIEKIEDEINSKRPSLDGKS
jgi:hypothetical protein